MTNSTFELTSNLIKGAAAKEQAARKHDIQLYRTSTIKYSISPLYSRYIGESVNVAYNGNFRNFPTNGKEFDISKGHLNALMKYLRHVDHNIRIAKTNAKFMDTNVSGDFKKI